MNSKNYVISKIDELSKVFTEVKFSYQLDELSETHFIEILPKDIFDNYDKDFVKEQNEVVLDFIKKFPEEGMAFITKGDLFVVDNPIYVSCGVNYRQNHASLSWYTDRLEQLLLDFEPQIKGSLVFTQKMEEIGRNTSYYDFTLTERKSLLQFEPLTNNLSKKSTKADYGIAGMNEFEDTNTLSLAA